jgi:hypothetical protein
MYAKDQWGAITAYIRSEDRAEIKSLKEQLKIREIEAIEFDNIDFSHIKEQNKQMLSICKEFKNHLDNGLIDITGAGYLEASLNNAINFAEKGN